jgi:hypothetical protein
MAIPDVVSYTPEIEAKMQQATGVNGAPLYTCYMTHLDSQIGKNIFEVDLSGKQNMDNFAGMPDTACIIGTGPSAREGIFRLPENSWRIGVNGAITLPVELHAHMVFDVSFPRNNPPAWESKREVLRIWGDMVDDGRADYIFNVDICNPLWVTWGRLRGDCTVAGAALGFLYWCYHKHGSPDKVYITGCDMSCGVYVDGSPTSQTGDWAQRENFSGLIKTCTMRGMDIYHIGHTGLEVERV